MKLCRHEVEYNHIYNIPLQEHIMHNTSTGIDMKRIKLDLQDKLQEQRKIKETWDSSEAIFASPICSYM